MLPMSIKLVNFMMTHRLAMDNWDVQQTSYINKYFFVIRRGCTVDIIVVELVKYPFWDLHKQIDKLRTNLTLSEPFSLPRI